MTAYMITYGFDPKDRTAVYRFADRAAARAALDGGALIPKCPANARDERVSEGHGFVVEDEGDVPFHGPLLVDVFNALTDSGVKRFENRGSGVRRLFNVLPNVSRDPPEPTAEESKVYNEPDEELDDADQQSDIGGGGDQQSDGSPTMGDGEAEARAAKPAAAPKKPARVSSKATGKDPKPAADFHPVRDGTVRAALIRHMDGTRTTEQLAAVVDKTPQNTHAHIFCLWRDGGFGFKYDAEGRVTVKFPRGKTIADAIVAPLEKKSAPAEAGAAE